MLLRFSVANYLSIREEAELSFIATAFKDDVGHLIATRYSKYGVLPVVALYGANASGKSNILDALGFLRSLVMNSFKRAEDTMLHRPFLLDEDSAAQPSTFILDFIMEDVRYQYGVMQSKQRVHEEWLYTFPKQIKQVLFSRSDTEQTEYYFGRSFAGSNRQIQSITRPTALFLSAGATSGHPLLTRISDYFATAIRMRSQVSAPLDEVAKSLEQDAALQKEVVAYLAKADTGIADMKISTESMPEDIKQDLTHFYAALSKLTNLKVPQRNTQEEVMRKVELGHSSADGKVRYLRFEDESLGTKHLFAILPQVFTTLKNGTILVLDEITTSLHTLLARQLVSIFQDPLTNPKGAQLVFSTHDTNLLSPGLLRRDEVWFAEKSSDGRSVYFPLSDIKTKNTDNIERGYVQGRFGAIPFLRFA